MPKKGIDYIDENQKFLVRAEYEALKRKAERAKRLKALDDKYKTDFPNYKHGHYTPIRDTLGIW